MSKDGSTSRLAVLKLRLPRLSPADWRGFFSNGGDEARQACVLVDKDFDAVLDHTTCTLIDRCCGGPVEIAEREFHLGVRPQRQMTGPDATIVARAGLLEADAFG